MAKVRHFMSMPVVVVWPLLNSDFCDPMTLAHQAPLSMGFPRQEYCSGLPFPSPGDFSDPGIELESPAWQANPLPLYYLENPISILSCL